MKDNLSINKNSKLFALYLNIYNPKENFEITKNYFKSESPSDLINMAQNSNCDILALRFNAKELTEIPECVNILKSNLSKVTKPIMICATGDDFIDEKLLPELIKNLDRENCIISGINEKTYKQIIPQVIKGNHFAVLKTPIDINLAKELNILSVDLGLDINKIIMNTDIGGLGYGYEYGFSIMEKVRQESEKGDKYLDLPLLSEAVIEALKTKEAKSDDFSSSWGNLQERVKMIELSSASGVVAAGANIILMASPDNIKIMKGLV